MGLELQESALQIDGGLIRRRLQSEAGNAPVDYLRVVPHYRRAAAVNLQIGKCSQICIGTVFLSVLFLFSVLRVHILCVWCHGTANKYRTTLVTKQERIDLAERQVVRRERPRVDTGHARRQLEASDDTIDVTVISLSIDTLAALTATDSLVQNINAAGDALALDTIQSAVQTVTTDVTLEVSADANANVSSLLAGALADERLVAAIQHAGGSVQAIKEVVSLSKGTCTKATEIPGSDRTG